MADVEEDLQDFLLRTGRWELDEDLLFLFNNSIETI